MGSPVVAIIALVLGYTLIRAGIKNESIVASFQGEDVSNPTTVAATAPGAVVSTTPSNLAASSPVHIGKVVAQ